ncbi:MAG TPA: hypothetical protein VMU93_16745 [Caulobacteraceae bacterium]|nr:hypothetical protein [Caulobacteraceae bacterium]
MQHRHRAGAFERLSSQAASSLLGHFLANQEEMLEKLERFFFPEYIRLIARLLPEAPPDDGTLDDDGQDDDGWDAVPAFAPSDEASGCGEPGEAPTVVNGESTAPDAQTGARAAAMADDARPTTEAPATVDNGETTAPAPRGAAMSGGAPWASGPPATVDNGENTAGAGPDDPST